MNDMAVGIIWERANRPTDLAIIWWSVTISD